MGNDFSQDLKGNYCCCSERIGRGDQIDKAAKINQLVKNRLALGKRKRKFKSPMSSQRFAKNNSMISTVRQQYQTQRSSSPNKINERETTSFCLPQYSPEYIQKTLSPSRKKSDHQFKLIKIGHKTDTRISQESWKMARIGQQSQHSSHQKSRSTSIKRHPHYVLPQKDYLGRSITNEELLSSCSDTQISEVNADISSPLKQTCFDEQFLSIVKYAEPFPLMEFEPHDHNKSEKIQQFQYWDGNFEILERQIVLTKRTLQIFVSFEDWQDEPDSPLLQIPLAAIDKIVQQINLKHLPDQFNEHLNCDKVEQFFKNKFIIKLKDDFLNLFLLDQYSEYGLPESYVQNVLDGKISIDTNQRALKDYFTTMQNQIIMKNNAINCHMEQDLSTNPQLQQILLNKMLIMSCENRNIVECLDKITQLPDHVWWPNSKTSTPKYSRNYSIEFKNKKKTLIHK